MVHTKSNIVHGDALAVLKTLDTHSIDSIVTDPPGGINFMGKSWDSNKGGRDQWIAWLASIMREALRTLKPGGHCFVWALPRTSHWTATALEDAGFEIRDVIHHMYSADTALHSFLASLNAEQREAFERLIDSQGSSVIYALFGSGFPKSLSLDKAIDKHFDAEREVVGSKYNKARSTPIHQGGLNASTKFDDITAPATDAAKTWQGWGSNLKPSAEHWILCRKPLAEKNIAAQVLATGTGALNIDASRIASGQDYEGTARVNAHKFGGVSSFPSDKEKPGFAPVPQGRFPSHLLLSHSLWCTDEQCVDGICPVLALDEQSGTRKSGGINKTHSGFKSNYIGGNLVRHINSTGYSDQGGASRYFAQFRPGDDVPPFYYAAKASRKERNTGCEALPMRAAGVGDARPSGDFHVRLDGNPVAPASNHHPTVKPLSLLKYLATLITPPNGVILDCFAGSGTTGVAAVHCGFRYVLIEQSAEYVEIARARVAYAEASMRELCEVTI